MNWLKQYGYSDCVFCDIVAHRPWEPAKFVYEDEEVAVFHNVLGWIPVMLLVVPRGRTDDGVRGERHLHQEELWRAMGRLGRVAIEMGRRCCTIDGVNQFRLVSNIGALALQSQAHAHMHVLGTRFQPHYPDLRTSESLVHEDARLLAYRAQIASRMERESLTALMVVPRGSLTQDEFFARMDEFGPTIVELARRHVGASYRILAEVGPHAPLPDNDAHLFVLGGGWLGHYV